MEAHDAPIPEDTPQNTDDMLRQILEQQQQHRAEVAQLREELAAAKSRTGVATAPATALSEEELRAARLDEISNHSHYCPACGRLYDYQRECAGRPEAPHPPIDVVSVDELHPDADPANHTAAPNTDVPAPV